MSKNGKEITKIMSYRLQFIDSAKYMASSLSNLLDNLAKGIHKIKCKYRNDEKNVKLAELNTKIAIVVLNTQALKMM